MFAVIYIPDFFLQAALRPEPHLSSARPVALVDARDSNPRIVQFTLSARDAGVSAGMTAVQALARCPDILIKSRFLAQERAANQALLDCASAFSPYVELTRDGVCTLDLKGLTLSSFQEWGAKILDTLLRLNLAAQLGIGQTPLLAWHAARAARPISVIEDPRQFVRALPVETLDPSPELLGIFSKWGIRNTGELLDLGREAVAERLGQGGLELFDRASADAVRPLEIVHAPQTFEEAIEFDHEVETAEALLFVLNRFVEQLSLRLEMVYLVAEEMTLRLTLADGSKYERVLKIPTPTRKNETLFGMLQTHLESLRTEHAIIAVWLAAKPCRPASEQLELFEPALRDPNRFYDTLARLAALVGHDRVGVPACEPTYRPDTFRLREVDINHNGRNESPDCPQTTSRGLCLRRFRPPLAAHIQRRDGKLLRVNSSNLNERISKMSGPWQSSGDWWDKQRWSRLEWDIETDRGNLYRLSQQQGGRWFVDGVYD
jgi:protein ImuB